MTFCEMNKSPKTGCNECPNRWVCDDSPLKVKKAPSAGPSQKEGGNVMYIKIIKGDYAGRTAKALTGGKFDLFGKKVVGVRVDAGLAGVLVLQDGDYEETTPPRGIDGRFTKGVVK